MKKSARVSEKLVSPGLPDLQVATRLIVERVRRPIASKSRRLISFAAGPLGSLSGEALSVSVSFFVIECAGRKHVRDWYDTRANAPFLHLPFAGSKRTKMFFDSSG